VTFEDIVMESSLVGVHMKSERGRGGIVEGVTYRRIHMKAIAAQCVQVTLNFRKGLEPTNKTATPVFRNIVLEDIRCSPRR
jgi:polygalacturonase